MAVGFWAQPSVNLAYFAPRIIDHRPTPFGALIANVLRRHPARGDGPARAGNDLETSHNA
jgi:hypothetical protein